MINELCFARDDVTLSSYTVAHAIQSVSAFYDVTEGEVGALRKPRGPYKGFRYSVSKGARFLSSFFFLNENILFYITEGEAGRKFLPFKLNDFKMH